MREVLIWTLALTLLGCRRQPSVPDQPHEPPPPTPITRATSLPSTCYYAQNNFQGDDLPADERLRTRVKAYVWKNPIGLMLRRYVFQAQRPEQVTALAHEISERIFAEPDKVQARIEAIRLLVEDLYDCELMTPELVARVQMLHLEIERDRVKLDRQTSGSKISFSHVLPFFIGVAVLIGSEELRLQLWSVSRRLYNRVRRVLSWPEAPETGSVSLKGLFSRQFFRDYSFNRAYLSFTHLAIGYMILDLLSREHDRSVSQEMYELSGESLLALLSVTGL